MLLSQDKLVLPCRALSTSDTIRRRRRRRKKKKKKRAHGLTTMNFTSYIMVRRAKNLRVGKTKEKSQSFIKNIILF